MADVRALVEDLEIEQRSLQDLLAAISDADWLQPTPAPGWDVRDTISHLADTDEIAVDTVTDGPRSLNVEVQKYATPEDFTLSGCQRGREMAGSEVLAWWQEASERERTTFLLADPDVRVPWGLGMQIPSLVTARIMETWAHGLDVRAALDAPSHDTDTNLSHVAWLGVRALPYAFRIASREMPPGDLRVELELPSGATFTSGPDGSENRITGRASEFCRVFVQRMDRAEAASLTAEGELADAALDVARAYL